MPRVFVIDDDADVLTCITHALRRAGYDVVAYGRAVDALPLMRENPPDVLITDLVMPDYDGMTLIQTCRADPELAELPILAMSSSRLLAIYARAAGANDFLQKPLELGPLLEAITYLVENPD
jgi:CheY-like chemotaxis protein